MTYNNFQDMALDRHVSEFMARDAWIQRFHGLGHIETTHVHYLVAQRWNREHKRCVATSLLDYLHALPGNWNRKRCPEARMAAVAGYLINLDRIGQ